MRTARLMRIALAACVLVVALALSGLAGCGPSKAQIAAQQKDDCVTSMREVKGAIDLVHADSGVYPTIADVLKTIPGAKCPNGGTYTFDPNTDTISCSVHGALPASTGQ